MSDLRENILSVVDKKLQYLIKEFDDRTRGEIRVLWQKITPAPNCMHSSVLCRNIQEIMGRAYVARARLPADVISMDLSKVPYGIISQIRKPLMHLVERLLADPYYQLITSTPNVYDRKGAPSGKFLSSSFEHMLPLIQATAANTVSKGLRDVDAILEGLVLKAQLREMPSHSSEVTDVSINIVNSIVGTVQTGANSMSIISNPEWL